MILKRKFGAVIALAALLVCLSTAPVLAEARNYHMERNDYIAYLKQQIGSNVMERWRGSEIPIHNMEDIVRYLDMFEYWSAMAAEGQRHKLVEKELALLDTFKAKISAVQNEAFPRLRQAFTGVFVADSGKTNAKLHTEGARSRTIVFAGDTNFIEGDQSRFFDEELTQLLQSLRFDKALHEIANNSGSRTETLNLTSFGDNELAIFNPATGRYKQVK